MRRHVIPEDAIDLRQNACRARNHIGLPASAQKTRFIRKHGENSLAKVRGESLGEPVIHQADELGYCCGIQNVACRRLILVRSFIDIMEPADEAVALAVDDGDLRTVLPCHDRDNVLTFAGLGLFTFG